MLLQTERVSFGFEAFAPRPTANQQEFHTRAALHEFGGGIQQVIVPFEFEQASDLANDEVFSRESISRAKCWIVPGRQEWLQREAAENSGELFRLANAGGEELPGHGIRDRHEVVC